MDNTYFNKKHSKFKVVPMVYKIRFLVISTFVAIYKELPVIIIIHEKNYSLVSV